MVIASKKNAIATRDSIRPRCPRIARLTGRGRGVLARTLLDRETGGQADTVSNKAHKPDFKAAEAEEAKRGSRQAISILLNLIPGLIFK